VYPLIEHLYLLVLHPQLPREVLIADPLLVVELDLLLEQLLAYQSRPRLKYRAHQKQSMLHALVIER
jgi:hypothetical protein